MTLSDLTWLPAAILLAPLLCAVAIIAGGSVSRRIADWLTVGTMATACVGAVALAFAFFAGDRLPVQGPRYTWLTLPGGIHLSLGTWLDGLSVLMTVLVTFLGTLVSLYSTWYLHGDPKYPRFFWQFSFFCAAMLGIVLSDNLLMTFLCWELVGLGSYFLIGFWSHKASTDVDPEEQAMKPTPEESPKAVRVHLGIALPILLILVSIVMDWRPAGLLIGVIFPILVSCLATLISGLIAWRIMVFVHTWNGPHHVGMRWAIPFLARQFHEVFRLAGVWSVGLWVSATALLTFHIGLWAWLVPLVGILVALLERNAPEAASSWGITESRLSPAHAQLKAFIVNRVGDFGFLCGIALLAWGVLASGYTGDGNGFLSWNQIFQGKVSGMFYQVSFAGLSGVSLLTLIGIALFLGAVGKSAQFPLHTWLPDAMQGPTTASSIIHAATMVAAGVYLVARLYPFFTPDALQVIQWTGAITCLLAATMATVQWDLKAVLAYSTISQLGYMLLALGSGGEAGYHAGVAHLFTHAIFKCLLFLCAAAVIHACHGNRNLHRMGGLWRQMPVTAIASGAAVLAILGTPLFSGFYSKDAVLAAALESAHGSRSLVAFFPFILGSLTALLTAYYMTRWWVRIFLGRSRDEHLTDHAHDPWLRGKLVLALLLIGCFQVVWTGMLSPFASEGWIEPALSVTRNPSPNTFTEHPGLVKAFGFFFSSEPEADELFASCHVLAMHMALVGLLLGAGTALVVWLAKGGALATRLASVPPLSWLRSLFANLWFIDRLQDLVVVRGGLALAGLLGAADLGTADRLAKLEATDRGSHPPSIDGAVDGVGRLTRWIGSFGNGLLTGRLNLYLGYAVALTALALLTWWEW